MQENESLLLVYLFCFIKSLLAFDTAIFDNFKEVYSLVTWIGTKSHYCCSLTYHIRRQQCVYNRLRVCVCKCEYLCVNQRARSNCKCLCCWLSVAARKTFYFEGKVTHNEWKHASLLAGKCWPRECTAVVVSTVISRWASVQLMG